MITRIMRSGVRSRATATLVAAALQFTPWSRCGGADSAPLLVVGDETDGAGVEAADASTPPGSLEAVSAALEADRRRIARLEAKLSALDGAAPAAESPSPPIPPEPAPYESAPTRASRRPGGTGSRASRPTRTSA
ncbi:MAG: hypothetical protein ACKON7_09225 [Planctomycetaceae bacterium]